MVSHIHLGILEKLVADRCPSESPTDILLSVLENVRSASDRVACLVDIATDAPQLAAAALIGIVLDGKLGRNSAEEDGARRAFLDCLPSFAPQIGALLRRPSLAREMHATEPFAATSLVEAMLGLPYSLPVTLPGIQHHHQAFRQMRSAAEHCLEVTTAELDKPWPGVMEESWHLTSLGIAARLASHSAADLPAGSAERLAAIVAYCHRMVARQHVAPDSVPEEVAFARCGMSQQRLAYKALLAALEALGILHKTQPLSPAVAALSLQALSTFITVAVRTAQTPARDWVSVYMVPLVAGALQSAPEASVAAFLPCTCRAMQDHALPDPSHQPTTQVLIQSVEVCGLLSVHAEAVADSLAPCANSVYSRRLGSNPRGGVSIFDSILHAPPLQAQWQAALAAALRAVVLPWLDKLPAEADLAQKLVNCAIRLTSPAAGALTAAAGDADPAAALEQPSAVALANALDAFLDVPMQHVTCALMHADDQPNHSDFLMAPLRYAAASLRAMASATAEATVRAEEAGRPPPSEALLDVACRGTGTAQLRLAQAEHECKRLERHRMLGEQRRDLQILQQALVLQMEMHSSGAAVRSMLYKQHAAAGLTMLVWQLATPDTPWCSNLGLASLPVLQAACKALAQLVAGSSVAKQQCLGNSDAGTPPWPAVAAVARQELRRQPARVRLLGEKALQQVEQALQGGQQAHQQAGAGAGAAGAASAPQRSQADADLAMRALLEEEGGGPDSKPSKAAQKRARKKAAAKQAAGASAEAAADTSQRQPCQVVPADTQTHSVEPSSNAAAADLQQLRLDASAVAADTHPSAAPGNQPPADDWMMCPLSKAIMTDPVMCSDGHTYSRAAITAWLDANGATSPLTSQPLARDELIPNHALRNLIEALSQQQARTT